MEFALLSRDKLGKATTLTSRDILENGLLWVEVVRRRSLRTNIYLLPKKSSLVATAYF